MEKSERASSKQEFDLMDLCFRLQYSTKRIHLGVRNGVKGKDRIDPHGFLTHLGFTIKLSTVL